MKKKSEKIQIGAEKPSAVFSSADFWLDRYDEMFSDFDPSPYEGKMVSEDFIAAVMRRFPEGSAETFHLRISVPKKVRSVKIEEIIQKRFGKYFGGMAAEYEKAMKKEQKKGITYFIAGCISLLAFIGLGIYIGGIIADVLGILFLPLGWFGVWEGTGKILGAPEKYEKKQELYHRLAHAKYEFISEEELLKKIRKK